MKKNNRLGYFFMSPYFLVFIILFLLPLIWSGWLALTDWNMISPTINFVGVNNFLRAIDSSAVKAAFAASYKFMIVLIPMVMILSMGIAMLVNSLPNFKGLFLVGFFLPYLSSGVATSFVVKNILGYNSPFTKTFSKIFRTDIDWFSSPWMTIFIISFMVAWKMSGYYALILFSGLNSINQEIYEAANIDGVSKWQKFSKITFPLLYPSILTVLILAVGLNFGLFTEIFQLTQGGPNFATNTWQIEIYNQAFLNLNSGYASAIAIIASIVTFISIELIRKIIEAWGRKNAFED